MSNDLCLFVVGAVLLLIGMFLTKENVHASYSGTDLSLVGVEYKPKFKSKVARIVGFVSLLAGILACIIGMYFAR